MTRGAMWLVVGIVTALGGPLAAHALDVPTGTALPFVFAGGVALANGLRTIRESL